MVFSGKSRQLATVLLLNEASLAVELLYFFKPGDTACNLFNLLEKLFCGNGESLTQALTGLNESYSYRLAKVFSLECGGGSTLSSAPKEGASSTSAITFKPTCK